MCIEAYIAGIIDGEGSISIRPNGHPTLIVVNTDRTVMELLASWAGFGNIRERDRSPHKTIFQWELSGEKAQQVLRRVLPFLIIKKAKADMGLTWVPRPQGRPPKLDQWICKLC